MHILRAMLFFLCMVSAASADCNFEEEINPEFAKSLKLAIAGNVIEQRNVAVSYEVGYLVDRCFEQAYSWYQKAAKSKDDISIRWVARNEALLALAAGKECFGTGCHPNSVEGALAGAAYSGNHGHFFAPLTINDKTVHGLIDSGASDIALTEAVAKELGLDFSSGLAGSAQTANGVVSTRNLIVPTLFVSGVRLDDVQVSCCVTGQVLIGMSFLRRVRVSMAGGSMSFQK